MTHFHSTPNLHRYPHPPYTHTHTHLPPGLEWGGGKAGVMALKGSKRAKAQGLCNLSIPEESPWSVSKTINNAALKTAFLIFFSFPTRKALLFPVVERESEAQRG